VEDVMNKRLFAVVLICVILLVFVGCTQETIQVNVSSTEELYYNQLGDFIKISENLSYDSATRVVYIYNGNAYGGSYTPYYAPNGLLYKYNPETNTLEEINR
jgi:hypothetical protein